MAQVLNIISLLTSGCLLALILVLISAKIPRVLKFPIVLFTLCVLGYVLVDAESIRHLGLQYPFMILAIILPFSYWFFSLALFRDDFSLRPWIIFLLTGAVLIQMALVFGSELYLTDLTGEAKALKSILQFLLPVSFVLLGLFEAGRGRQADLIVQRLQFRNYFLLITGLIIILTLISEIAFRQHTFPLYLVLGQRLVISILIFYFAIRMLTVKTVSFFQKRGQDSASPTLDGEEKMIWDKLTYLMSKEQYWRIEGLTIRQLADVLKVKEYKLRRLINTYSGFSNFNQYLHAYRLEEACNILSDPKQKQKTVLEIAYSLGYNSLAPFNKAFKQKTGMSPTAWRSHHS